MIVVIQRALTASVEIEKKIKAAIGKGLVILVGIAELDGDEDIQWLTNKIVNLRIFPDEEGTMNLNVKDIQGEVLMVSQFTLHASIRKGNRPSFIKAARPAVAIPLYEKFIHTLEVALGKPIQTGLFGADMKVGLTNDGPVTIIIDTHNKV